MSLKCHQVVLFACVIIQLALVFQYREIYESIGSIKEITKRKEPYQPVAEPPEYFKYLCNKTEHSYSGLIDLKMQEWFRQDKIKTLKERMPDTPMDKDAEKDTDAWNFINCEQVLGTYPPKYINPQREYNKESWGNIKITIENPDSVAHRCHPTNIRRPLAAKDEGKKSIMYTEHFHVWISDVQSWRDKRTYNPHDNLQCNQEDQSQYNPVVWRFDQIVAFDSDMFNWFAHWEPNELNRTHIEFKGSIDAHAYLLPEYWINRQVLINIGNSMEPQMLEDTWWSWTHNNFTVNENYGFISNRAQLLNETVKTNIFGNHSGPFWNHNSTKRHNWEVKLQKHLINKPVWLAIFNLDFLMTQYNGWGFGSTLNNWEIVGGVKHTYNERNAGDINFKHDGGKMEITMVVDTDDQMRTIIKYKTFFECMLEVGLVVEVIQETFFLVFFYLIIYFAMVATNKQMNWRYLKTIQKSRYLRNILQHHRQRASRSSAVKSVCKFIGFKLNHHKSQ